MPKMIQSLSSICLLTATLLPISSGLSGYDNTDILTYNQNEVAPGRLISFGFFPGELAGAVGDFTLGLEGLYLSGRGDLDGFTLSDETNRYWVSRSAHGWYAVEVVKRYLTQDLEVWVDGIPIFLSEALEPLDPLLELDAVILQSDGYPAFLAAGKAENLSRTTASIFDMDYIAPSEPVAIAMTSLAPLTPTTDAGGREAELKTPVDSPVASAAGAAGAADSPSQVVAACSGLFTPLF